MLILVTSVLILLSGGLFLYAKTPKHTRYLTVAGLNLLALFVSIIDAGFAQGALIYGSLFLVALTVYLLFNEYLVDEELLEQ